MSATSLLIDAVTVRTAGLADADALLALHRAGFGSDWQMRHWLWRYADNPLRRTEITGAFTADGRCLASFCGVPLPCLYGGQTGIAQRAGDVVVHPVLRASMAGAGVMRRVADLFFRRFGGGDTRIVFGFPEAPLLRTIVRHVRCEVMADVPALVRDAGDAGDAGDGSCRAAAVEWTAGLPPGLDALTSRVMRQAPTGVRRDAAYLRWRYVDNPHARYHFATVKGADGAPLAAAIVRDGGVHPDTAAIVEWLVPHDLPDHGSALLAAVARFARRHGRTSLAASFAASSREFESFQVHHGFRVRVSLYQLVFRSYCAGIDRGFLFANWFHSLGDIDGA